MAETVWDRSLPTHSRDPPAARRAGAPATRTAELTLPVDESTAPTESEPRIARDEFPEPSWVATRTAAITAAASAQPAPMSRRPRERRSGAAKRGRPFGGPASPGSWLR